MDEPLQPNYQSITPPIGFQKLRKVPFYRNKTIDLAAVAIFLFVLAGVFAAYTYLKRPGTLDRISPLASRLTNSDVGPARNVMNPITGVLYTADESASWIGNRPFGVMVNNHVDARPQSGLIYADLVYEIVAEGGITRFLPFYLSHLPEKVGPIRSTREYYLVLVKEMGDAMLMHEGYSPQALEAIQSWPVRSLQRGGASFINWRDNPRNVATEHTLYSNPQELYKYGVDTLGWGGNRELTSWKFKDEKKVEVLPDVCLVGACKPIVVDFWYPGDFSAIWTYDSTYNEYLRSTGYDDADQPIPHLDQETKEQIKVKTLVIQFAEESSIVGDDKNRLDYELIGSGEGMIFMDGSVTNVTWSKEDRDARTRFYDQNGNEFEFNRGKIWISIVPERNRALVVF